MYLVKMIPQNAKRVCVKDGWSRYLYFSFYVPINILDIGQLDADKVAASPLMYIVQLHRIHKSFKTPITKAEIQW